jgi:hypothetical protein
MRVRRAGLIDVLTRDGETAVLVDGHILRLSALGAAVLELTEDWVDIEVLAGELGDRFGAPAGRTPREATVDAIADMVRNGVLVTAPTASG